MKHAVGYCNHSITYTGFQLLKIIFDPEGEALHINPQKKKSQWG
jgi:hypothetical protein